MKSGKGFLLGVLLCIMVMIMSACVNTESTALPVVEDYEIEKPDEVKDVLKLGVVTGPYGDMFMETIAPYLEEKGYEIQLLYYASHDETNFALAGGIIDLNMFQHYTGLNNFKLTHDLSLSAVTEIPTAAMGAYSKKYDNLTDLEMGATVAVPSDDANMARALTLLDSAGVITLDYGIDKSYATENDIVRNQKEIRFIKAEASYMVKALDIYDMAIISGSYAVSAGYDPTMALCAETLSENNKIVIAVRSEELGSKFVSDILEVVYSDEYYKMITDPDGKYFGYQRPGRFFSRG